MVRKIIDVGVEGNDATGDAIRDAFTKVNDNFNELYSTLGEGDGIPFTSLSDTPDELTPNTVFMVNPSGNALIAKSVVAGEGIDIDFSTNPDELRIISLSTKLKDDVNPTLGGNLNALDFYIFDLKDPNTTIGSQTTYAISKGYADNRYVNISGDVMSGALEISNATAASSTSTGALVVGGGAGIGGELHVGGVLSIYTEPKNPQHAATKQYVDTNSYSSTVNFFVNTNGRTWAQMDLDEVPESKRGRAHAYAFSTISEACQYAEDAIFSSSVELGPYKQLITFNSGASLSTVNNVTDIGSGRYRLQITNFGGTVNVDQGNPLNTDLISGKLIVGATSNAKGLVYQYRGVQAGYDEIDITLISGTFANGENLYFDNATPTVQITINVESGIYNEHLPIRVSKNVSIIGDELRRTIVRPLDAVSQSPWVRMYFYRDLSIDSNTLASSNYGYHYLTDISDRTSTPKNNRELDMFLMNDATGIKDITFQGHGGFSIVLDPEGQILTKSPYIQNCSSVASGANIKKFRGGMFIDGFAGRQTATITAVNSTTELEISGLTFVKARALAGDTETNRRPVVPCSFWINGQRYNVQSIRLYDDLTGTATIVLGTPYAGGSGFPITLETAGNKSALATHFTQVNDLGYGIVAANNALIELVSVFTYFCHTAYYSYNGAQIRSVAGSNAHGFIGLKAEGSDPLEVPRPIILADNLTQVAKVYKRGSTFSGTDYNSQDSSLLAVTDFEFIPYSVTEIEINHPVAGTTLYTATSVAMVANTPTISTASRTSSTVTITTATDHGFQAGDNVIISGVSDPVFDQIAVVLAGGLTSNQFTYTSVGSGSASGTGGTAKLNVSIAKLSLGTGLGGSVSFLEDMNDGDYVVLRSKQNFKFYGNFVGISTRPSTALDFTNDVDTGAYRTIGFSSNYYDNAKSPSSIGYGSTENLNDAPALGSTNIISVDTNFNYVSAEITNLAGAGGASSLRISELSASDQIRIIGMEFGWVDQNVSQKGFKRKVTAYTATSPGSYATITLDSALPANTLIPIGTEIFFGVKEAASSTLSGSIAASGAVSTITLASTANFSPVGYIKIDNEYFSFTGNNTGTNTLTGITRAQVGSVEAGHSGGATVQEITGLLTAAISTCRATSHDFLNIGTGGYNTTNYPNNVFGEPVEGKVTSSTAIDSTGGSTKAEVQEKNKGRVFFMSTNQDGFFRVGRFFTVDQGTGSVAFNAGISLTNVDGLGFKRGITIAEFSNDASMPDLGDAVPTNAAVREYINRRLGLDHNGTVNNDPIAPGFMPRDGTLAATGDMNMDGNQIVNVGAPVSGSDAANKTYVDLFLKRSGGTRTGVESFTMIGATGAVTGVIDMNSNKITNLATPTANGDAANKSYVDAAVATKDQLTELSDVNIVGATGPQALLWDSATGKWINSLISNASVSASAAIDQSKLNLNNATAATGVSVVTKGIAGYNSANFTAISGFVSLAPNGVSLSNLGQIPDRTAIANISGAQATPGATGIAGVVVEGIKDAFNNAGVVAMTATLPSKVVNTIAYSSTSAVDAIVQRDGSQGFSANGVVNVGQLNVDGVKAIDTVGGATGALEFYTPSGDLNISLTGSGASRASIFSGWIRTTSITTGATSAVGTLNGNWQLTAGSKLEATYADLAEYYEADQEYEIGAVLMIGGDREVTLARGECTTAVAGIVSLNPSYVMNSGCPGIRVAIALQGRVPCRVVGKIKRGDLLIVSQVPGVATASKTPVPGSIIGKALNDYDSDRIGVIEVMVGKH